MLDSSRRIANSRQVRYSAHARPTQVPITSIESHPGLKELHWDPVPAVNDLDVSVFPCLACYPSPHEVEGHNLHVFFSQPKEYRRVESLRPQTIGVSGRFLLVNDPTAGPQGARGIPLPEETGVRVERDEELGAYFRALTATERMAAHVLPFFMNARQAVGNSFFQATREMNVAHERVLENVFLPKIEQSRAGALATLIPRQPDDPSKDGREDKSAVREVRISIVQRLDSSLIETASRNSVLSEMDREMPADHWHPVHDPSNEDLLDALMLAFDEPRLCMDWRSPDAPDISALWHLLWDDGGEEIPTEDAALLHTRLLRECIAWGIDAEIDRAAHAFPEASQGQRTDVWQELIRTIVAAYRGRSFAASFPARDGSQLLPSAIAAKEILHRLPTHWVQALAVAIERAGLLRDEFGTIVAWRASIAAARMNDDEAAEEWSVAIDPTIVKDNRLRREVTNYCELIRSEG